MPILDDNVYYRGHISYYHPTIFNKEAVPSNFHIDSTMGRSYRSLIAFWCSLGFSISFYDGVGLGINYYMIHPYVLLPWVNVQSMYYILNIMISILLDTYYKKGTKEKVPHYSIGYSEGGSLSIWHQYCFWNTCQDITTRASSSYDFINIVGLEGAYDTYGTVIPFLI